MTLVLPISTISFGVGTAALIAGGVLWFTAPSAPRADTRAQRRRWMPMAEIDQRSITVEVKGTW